MLRSGQPQAPGLASQNFSNRPSGVLGAGFLSFSGLSGAAGAAGAVDPPDSSGVVWGGGGCGTVGVVSVTVGGGVSSVGTVMRGVVSVSPAFSSSPPQPAAKSSAPQQRAAASLRARAAGGRNGGSR